MAEEKEPLEVEAGAKIEGVEEDDAAAKGGGKKKKPVLLLIVVLAVAVVLAAVAYFGYPYIRSQGNEKPATPAAETGKKETKIVLFSMDPFVVNLSEPGRYLKVTMQFELSGEADEKSIPDKVPILRDVIITLIGNQTYEYAASAEGKIRLKEDILLRTNRIFGREVFRNLYFTEFVMQ